MKTPGFTAVAAVDWLHARQLLRQVGLSVHYAPLLIATTDAWSACARRIPPHRRLQWALKCRQWFKAPDDEHAIAQIALLWLGNTQYASDTGCSAAWPEPETARTASHLPHTPAAIDWQATAASGARRLEWVESDTQAMLERCLALLTEALRSGKKRLAMGLTDRVVTRRILGALQARGYLGQLQVQDAWGWAASTSYSAARLMRLIEQASAERAYAGCRVMADFVRKTAERLQQQDWWRHFAADAAGRGIVESLGLQAHAPLIPLPAQVPLTEVPPPLPFAQALPGETSAREAYAHKRTHLEDFVHWVRYVLDAVTFNPYTATSATNTAAARLCICSLPELSAQAHSCDWILVPAADAQHLPMRAGHTRGIHLSEAQRVALFLSSTQAQFEQTRQQMYDLLCARAPLHLVRARTHESQEVAASPWLELWHAYGLLQSPTSPAARAAVPPRRTQATPAPVHRPQAGSADATLPPSVSIAWQQLAPATLSASAYADLKACPYRFFALRILGLRDPPELFDAVSRRDFGQWLHGVLQRFHAQAWNAQHSVATLRQAIEVCARTQTRAMALDAAAFLPFSLMWEATRESYLAWLHEHLQHGYRSCEVEHWHTRQITVADKRVSLVGRLDRLDARVHEGQRHELLIDYKSEALARTKERVDEAQEDTQLTFYVALLEDARRVQAAYLHLPQRHDSRNFVHLLPLENVAHNAEELLVNLQTQLDGIAAGQPMEATGEAQSCQYCTARGICRKDFWSQSA